jgi:uncharacterized LabA/DUF88 family protein
MPNNFAFIDGQNLNLGINALGWKLDFKRFRIHLKESYGVSRAYYFIGLVPENQPLYTFLQNAGYTLVFKQVKLRREKLKGNVDAELVLQVMIEYGNYDRAVVVTSDGDFTCLVRHLYEKKKLERVLSPNRDKCSDFLRQAARERIDFIEEARQQLEYKKREGAPRQDQP